MAALIAGGLCAHSGALAQDEPKDENIVRDLAYAVETGVGIKYSYSLTGSEKDPGLGLLTDGAFSASDHYSDGAWHIFYRGLSRCVTFALPEEKAVTGFMISLLQNNPAGIQISNYYDLYVSENQTDWMLAHTIDTASKTTYADTRRLKLSAENIGKFKAKYIKIKFRVEVGAYIDEVEVYGRDIDGTEAPFVKYEDPYDYKNAYGPKIEGAHDTVLLYCGYHGKYDLSFVQNTEEEMLYYVGYVSKDGEVTDTMFDSVMFSALGDNLPSGRNFKQGGDPPLMSDWQFYIDSIFDKDYNCGAIERAFETVKKATGAENTIGLIINMPYPNIAKNSPFGDIDGDGETDYCRDKSDQLKIFAWFMDAVKARMAEENYKNITLKGFYWEQEGIATKRGEGEYDFIKSVSDLAHERDVYFFWIPFLYANGMDKTYDMGFDSAMMQPNLAFLEYAKPEMLYELDESLRKYGLGIEMEIHWDAVNLSAARNADFIHRFYSYLNGGYVLGYMQDAAHSYYQNSNPGSFYVAAKSQNSTLRAIYDDLHAFIKHTYVPYAPTLTSKEFTARDGEKLYGYISVKKGVYKAALGEVTLELVSQASHGTLELNTKTGDFSYVPDPAFDGTDSFTVIAKNAFVKSEPYVCQIAVLGSGSSEKEASSEVISQDDESPDEKPAKKNIDGKLKAALYAGGALIVLAAAFLFGKAKAKAKKKAKKND